MVPPGPLPARAPSVTTILISIITDELGMFSDFIGTKPNRGAPLCLASFTQQ